MKPGPALSAWLADRDAQARSYARVEAAAAKYSAAPFIARLDREVIELADRTPENLIAAARRFIDQSGEIEAMMLDLIGEARADPYFRPPFHPLSSEVHNSLLLYHHPELSVSLGVTGLEMLASKKVGRKGGASINFTGFLTLLRFVKSGGATLSFWECEPIDADFSATAAPPCRLAGRRRVEDGEEFVIDGRFQSFVIEHAERDILFLQAVARTGGAPVGVEYDSDSHELIGASSTDEPSSRLQMMVSLLRAQEREDAFPLFEEALSAPQFYTRWHIMREMLAMDADAALPSLRRLAEADPHPDVRAAARQTLGLFFPDARENPGGASCPA